MTTISIAMATYNGSRFIRRQLESFSQQSLLPDELIVCDDGSTDSTVSIVSEFCRAAQFPVVLVQNPQRLGYTANFLQAARMCRGDLVAFSDQDDEWLPQKLSHILHVARNSDALVFAHSAEWIDENGNPLGVIYPTHPRFRRNLKKDDFPGHAIVLRRALLEVTSHSLTAGNYKQVAGDLEIGHDALLMEVATAMSKVLFIPEVLVRWRIHSVSNHAWTHQLQPAAGARISIADRIYPPDLAQRYSEAGSAYRKHAAMLSCVVRDLAAVQGTGSAASGRLFASIAWMTKQADVMELRAKFYCVRRRRARLRLMMEGAAMGQYRKAAQGGVGIHNALRDLVACFFGGR